MSFSFFPFFFSLELQVENIWYKKNGCVGFSMMSFKGRNNSLICIRFHRLMMSQRLLKLEYWLIDWKNFLKNIRGKCAFFLPPPPFFFWLFLTNKMSSENQATTKTNKQNKQNKTQNENKCFVLKSQISRYSYSPYSLFCCCCNFVVV